MHRRVVLLALGGLAIVVAIVVWWASTTGNTEAPRVQKVTATSDYRQPALTAAAGTDAHAHHHHPGMSMDMQGAVMGENKGSIAARLPANHGGREVYRACGQKARTPLPGADVCL